MIGGHSGEFECSFWTRPKELVAVRVARDQQRGSLRILIVATATRVELLVEKRLGRDVGRHCGDIETAFGGLVE
jgi:hypothetical protein